MKKSLIALAVLGVAGVASAQSNVTLSGILKSGVAQTRYSNGAAGNGSNTSMADGSSRFVFSGREDLGGGMAGVFQIDTRFRVDDNGAAPGSSPLATGNTFVGLAGGFGQVRLGKMDTHYCLGSDEHGARATALAASSCGVLGYVGSVAAPIANTSRSVNVIRYDLPSNMMAGVTGGIAYSTNFAGNDGAIGDAGKGRAWNINGGYASGPLTLGASFWDGETEARTAGAAVADQQAWTLTGSWNFGIAKVGLTYDRSSLDAGLVGAPLVEAKRTAWSIPITANLGPGTVLFTYTRAGDVKVGGVTAANSDARLWSIGYDYPLSKRTSVGVSYVNLNNGAAASYQLYTSGALQSLPAVGVGQDQRQFYIGLRHAF